MARDAFDPGKHPQVLSSGQFVQQSIELRAEPEGQVGWCVHAVCDLMTGDEGTSRSWSLISSQNAQSGTVSVMTLVVYLENKMETQYY